MSQSQLQFQVHSARPTAARRTRFFRSLLIGIALALLLTCIELIAIWIVNPLAIIHGGDTLHRLLALVALPIHQPLTLLVPLVEVVGLTFGVYLAIKPLALRAYLRDLQKAQERYRQAYTSLPSLRFMYDTAATYYQHTPDLTISPQNQSLLLSRVLTQPLDTSLLLEGVPGTGKTLALHYCQYTAIQQRLTLIRAQNNIPIYIPLPIYGLYLKTQQQQSLAGALVEDGVEEQTPRPVTAVPRGSLLDFLTTTDLPALHHLHPYLQKWLAQGRLLLLCDGLDEVDPAYQSIIGNELAELISRKGNRLVITSRQEVDQDLLKLVHQGQLERVVINPLQHAQMTRFIEQYIAAQGDQGQNTAGQILQAIDHSRLRYLCTNPLLLLTLLEIIDKVGLEEAKQLDSSGRLLRAYAALLIRRAQAQQNANKDAPEESEVLQLLSSIACAAHWSHDPYAIQLPVGSTHVDQTTAAAAVQAWLNEHPARGLFNAEQPDVPVELATHASIFQCALQAGLIELSAHGVLSFRHALLADYFVAEYFSASSSAMQPTPNSLAVEILANPSYWRMPVALYAALLDTPLQAAEWLAQAGQTNARYFTQALTLCLLCIGVAWTPPRSAGQHNHALPAALLHTLAQVVHDQSAREELADAFTACVQEGTWEIYHSLIPLLMVEGIEEFFVLLDIALVIDLLFTYLRDTADIAAYEAQVKRLCRIMWRFDGAVVDSAAQLSRPTPSNSLRLRSAAINILGGTHDAEAVPPLLERLGDAEKFIVDRSINALLRLGPQLTLPPLLEELEQRSPASEAPRVHLAILTIVTRYLVEKDSSKRLASSQYQRILETILKLLSSHYVTEPATQQHTRELLTGLITGQLAKFSGGPHLSKDLSVSKEAGAPPDVVAELAQPSSAMPPNSVGLPPHSMGLPPHSAGLPPPAAAMPSPAAMSPSSAAMPTIAHLVVSVLVKSLSAADELLVRNSTHVLEEANAAATPFIVEQLREQQPEIVRVRLIEILRHIRDPRALPTLLSLVADSSLLVQQQVTGALRSYSPTSIPGLIDLIKTDTSELVAEKAASILGEIGAPVVEPVAQALTPIVPGRTRLLVQVLERVRDARAIPPLVNLLQNASTSQSDPLLVIALIRSLGQFASRQVVVPILNVLSHPQPQIYEEAIDALSSLGTTALDALIDALNVREDTISTPRIRRAILGMHPFPGEALMKALAQANDVQAQQLMTIFRMQGADAAHVLVQHFYDADARQRMYVRRTLEEMQGPIAVPALLEVVNRPQWRDGVASMLLKYPEAIPPLVNLLGDPERAEAAVAILPQFGPTILPPLVSGLGDPRMDVREYAQSIVVTLVRQNLSALSQVVSLFASSLPLRAHESLLEVLTNELADVSIPALLAGLEDAHLVNDVSEALVRLARKRDWQRRVLSGLLDALRGEERRRGAATTLIKMGALAVQPVGELIADPDQAVARAAQEVLRQIGAPALPFIWAAHGDTSNRPRREAAMNIFHSMPTEAIKDALVDLLQGDSPEDIAMAQALLLERMHGEAKLPLAQQEMIPSLLEYVQIHDREGASLRILALLLLLGGETVVAHLVHVLYAHPEHHEQLAYIFLFLGIEAQQALLEILHDPDAPTRLRAEAVSMLGLLGPLKDVSNYAESLSSYGLTVNRTGVLNPDQLSIALRALGSLLASGDWDIPTLQNLRKISQEGSAQHELYNVLLGWRYEPEITRLRNELQKEREARNNEIMSLTARIVHNQGQIHDLQEQLEQISHEHGLRADELHQVTQEREAIRKNLDQIERERDTYRANLDNALREREVFRANLERALQTQQNLQAEVAQLQSYNALLQQQINQLRGTA